MSLCVWEWVHHDATLALGKKHNSANAQSKEETQRKNKGWGRGAGNKLHNSSYTAASSSYTAARSSYTAASSSYTAASSSYTAARSSYTAASSS